MPPVNTKSVMEEKAFPTRTLGVVRKKSDHKRVKLRDTVFKSPFDKHQALISSYYVVCSSMVSFFEGQI